MAELLLGASQSSLLRLQPKLLGFPNTFTSPIERLPSIPPPKLTLCFHHPHLSGGLFATRAVSSISKSSTLLANAVDSANKGNDPELEIGGGGGDKFGDFSGGGGGGGDSGGGGGDSDEGGGGESSDDSKRKMALSMSQKLTLGYAALVGVGGLMGYLKSGSQKSLFSGGLSAAVLYYVYSELPTKPVLASTIGFVVAAALMGVMGSRFMRSRKMFPAGVVSFVSLVMTGGYLHGILRSLH